MRRVWKWAGRLVLATAVLIQFIRPPRTNPVVDHSSSLMSARPVPADVQRVLDRGCRDCHSNDTRWPWYSRVAPVSWFVIDHVNHGRSHFNYSDWARYDAGEADRLFAKACSLVRDRRMPLTSYTWMHPSARLSDADVAALCAWTDTVRTSASLR